MSQFFHNNITDKSFQLLVALNENYNFVLIGGWAVFLYTNSLKSKDIDVVLDYGELGKFREEFTVNKNDRLKKYEIKTGEFDIDIYVPHYSELGIPAKEIIKSGNKRKGFLVPRLETLFLLKLYAWGRRRGSIKGRKDELDILCLVSSPEFNYSDYFKMIKKYDFNSEHKNLVSFLKETKKVSELKLNEQQVSKLKKKILPKIEKREF